MLYEYREIALWNHGCTEENSVLHRCGRCDNVDRLALWNHGCTEENSVLHRCGRCDNVDRLECIHRCGRCDNVDRLECKEKGRLMAIPLVEI